MTFRYILRDWVCKLSVDIRFVMVLMLSVLTITPCSALLFAQGNSTGGIRDQNMGILKGSPVMPHYKKHIITIKNGLPSNEVRNVFQDRFGMIWIMTGAGICRYDGLTVRPLRTPASEYFKPLRESVTSCVQDSTGAIWFATRDGLFRLLPKTGEWCSYLRDTLLFANSVYVKSLHCDSEGILWIGTAGGLLQYNRSQNRCIVVFPELIGKNIYGIQSDNDKRLWFECSDESYFVSYNVPTKTLTMLKNIDSQNRHIYHHSSLDKGIITSTISPITTTIQPPIQVQAVITNNSTKYQTKPLNVPAFQQCFIKGVSVTIYSKDDKGYYWLYVKDYAANKYHTGLYCVHETAEDLPAVPIISGKILGFLRDRKGIIWVGSLKSGLTMLLPTSMNKLADRAIIGDVQSSLTDSRGRLWCGSRLGLFIRDIDVPAGGNWRQIPVRTPGGSKHSVVVSGVKEIISPTKYPRDGQRQILCATSEGLYRFDEASKMCLPLPAFERSVVQKYGRLPLQRMVVDSRGDLWLYVPLRGLLHCSAQGELKHYWKQGLLKGDIPSEPIRSIAEDSRGTIWLAMIQHTLRYNAQTESFEPVIPKLLAPTHSSRTDGGSFALGNNLLSTWLISSTFLPLPQKFQHNFFERNAQEPHAQERGSQMKVGEPEKEKSTFLVNYKSIGLTLFSASASSTQATIESLPINQLQTFDGITSFCSTQGQYWWTIYNNSLYRCESTQLFTNPTTNPYPITLILDDNAPEQVFSSSNGDAQTNNVGSLNITQGGSLLVDYFGDLIGINPKKARSCNDTAHVLIAAWYRNDSLMTDIPESGDTVNLPRESSFAIDCGVLSFYRPGRHRLEYYLEGLDAQWQKMQRNEDRLLRYTNLMPGEYQLRIRTRSEDGTESDNYFTLFLIVPTPFWQLWYVAGSGGLMVFAGMMLLAQFIERQRTTRLLEELEVKRQQELKQERQEREVQHLRHLTSELQLKTLRLQMDPHFIFNALSMIQDLVLHNVMQGVDAISIFSDLLRQTLLQSEHNTVSVYEEIRLLERYVDLEILRARGAFDYYIDCFPNDGSIDWRHSTIPSFIIQPFVENAIRHGIRPMLQNDASQGSAQVQRRGAIRVSIQHQANEGESYLHCTIEDNGIGRAESFRRKQRRYEHSPNKEHLSVSTAITSERLALLQAMYKIQLVVTYEDLTDTITGSSCGTRVAIDIPCNIVIPLQAVSSESDTQTKPLSSSSGTSI